MAALPLLPQSEGLHPPIRPQPQRPPPPVQPKLAVTDPAELVTCDQTIEHTVRFCKQTLGWTTPAAAPSRAGRAVDLADPGLLCAAAPSPRGRGRCAAAVGATPTTCPAVTGAGLPRVSATAGSAGFPCGHAETLRALPRPTQGPLFGACRALPGDQEAHQQAPQEAAHHPEGCLTGPAHPPPADLGRRQPNVPEGVKSQAKSLICLGRPVPG
jgi:hypothetical protein